MASNERLKSVAKMAKAIRGDILNLEYRNKHDYKNINKELAAAFDEITEKVYVGALEKMYGELLRMKTLTGLNYFERVLHPAQSLNRNLHKYEYKQLKAANQMENTRVEVHWKFAQQFAQHCMLDMKHFVERWLFYRHRIRTRNNKYDPYKTILILMLFDKESIIYEFNTQYEEYNDVNSRKCAL